MSVLGFLGDPCSRCINEGGVSDHVQRAEQHGMCRLHWLGATETQRRAAVFEEGTGDADALLVLCESIASLPTINPERRAA